MAYTQGYSSGYGYYKPSYNDNSYYSFRTYYSYYRPSYVHWGYGHYLNYYSGTVILVGGSYGYGYQCPHGCAVDFRCGSMDECWYFYNGAVSSLLEHAASIAAATSLVIMAFAF